MGLRRSQGWGPHRIGWEPGPPRSTIYGVLRHLGFNRLAGLDHTTRRPIRCVRERLGELLRLDFKPLGRIPPGGGKRLDPRRPATEAAINRRPGAVSDSSTSTRPPLPRYAGLITSYLRPNSVPRSCVSPASTGAGETLSTGMTRTDASLQRPSSASAL